MLTIDGAEKVEGSENDNCENKQNIITREPTTKQQCTDRENKNSVGTRDDFNASRGTFFFIKALPSDTLLSFEAAQGYLRTATK